MTSPSIQLGEDRQQFLSRVRIALGKTPAASSSAAPASAPPPIDEQLVRLARAEDPLLDLFASRAEETGMIVHRQTQDNIADALIRLLETLHIKRAAGALGAAGRQLSLDDALARSGVEQVDVQRGDDEPNFAAQYELDAGLTDVHAALAETGTLVVNSDASHSRGLSLVPPIHIAIVRQSDIMPDMIDYWARLAGMPGVALPSSQVFITGPSKTADIEGELIVGVHGPGQVHILLVAGV
jgi:L-lactate dehydrogenase complex protein LldG